MRHGYNQAMAAKQRHIGFLMILMQRLVTSSTAAIRTTLEKREALLKRIQQRVVDQAYFVPIYQLQWPNGVSKAMKVSGMGLDAFLRTRILDPLDMRDTAFFLPAEKRTRRADPAGASICP